MESNELLSIASFLANDLEAERVKWFAACIELMKNLNESFDKEQSYVNKDRVDGEPNYIIKAFQAVHVLSFIHMQQYVGDKIGDLTRHLHSCMFEVDWLQSQPHVGRYTDLKQRFRGSHFREQFLKFSEDLSLAISGGPMGMLLAPAIDATVVDFYYRNLLHAAKAFSDRETGDELAQSIRRLHDERS
jgi:hypothetical protein